ncbi:MAG: METTL5 family protein [Halobacteriales archaeon]
MASRRSLERRLADLEAFEAPRVELEQYATPAHLAASLVHRADLAGDLRRPVVDLGAGTGILGLGAALRGAPRVVAVERDRAAVAVGRRNERRLAPPVGVDWVLADATRPPLARDGRTVLMNPPFGAQRGREHADRSFLAAAADLAAVSYSVHNAGSRAFVEAFAADHGGTVTHAFEAPLELDRQYHFHERDRAERTAEVFRIEWA